MIAPTPWRAEGGGIVDADGHAVIAFPEERARIVACVNYCAGVPSPQLNCTSLRSVLAGNNAMANDRLEMLAKLHEANRIVQLLGDAIAGIFKTRPGHSLERGLAIVAAESALLEACVYMGARPSSAPAEQGDHQ